MFAAFCFFPTLRPDRKTRNVTCPINPKGYKIDFLCEQTDNGSTCTTIDVNDVDVTGYDRVGWFDTANRNHVHGMCPIYYFRTLYRTVRTQNTRVKMFSVVRRPTVIISSVYVVMNDTCCVTLSGFINIFILFESRYLIATTDPLQWPLIIRRGTNEQSDVKI